MGLFYQMQADQMAYIIALLLNQHISTSIWKLFATATMIWGKESKPVGKDLKLNGYHLNLI